MERSAEVEAVVRDMYLAMSKGDYGAIDALIGTGNVRMVGTDPNEWWGPDRTEVLRVFTTQIQEMGGQIDLDPYEIEGYAEGDIGWAAAKVRIGREGEYAEARMTTVLHRESDGYRVVQGHVSFGVPNEETFGQELTTT